MSLLERMTCRVQGCNRRRAPDTDVCDADLTELWMHRLVKLADGTYVRRRAFTARDETRLAA